MVVTESRMYGGVLDAMRRECPRQSSMTYLYRFAPPYAPKEKGLQVDLAARGHQGRQFCVDLRCRKSFGSPPEKLETLGAVT